MSGVPPKKTAIILFNLGGPDGPEAVEPFLFNLFNDPAIIRVPNPLRWLIAKLVSKRRAPVAREIYAELGGSSPLVPLTEAQARALEAALVHGASEVRAFLAMRYWRPFADEAARAAKEWAPPKWCCCRSIRNIRPRRRNPRSRTGNGLPPKPGLPFRQKLFAAIPRKRALSPDMPRYWQRPSAMRGDMKDSASSSRLMDCRRR